MVLNGELPSYAVVSPVRDEAEHFWRTACSLVAQSHRPVHWVVVDDGSTDGTREMAEAFAADHDWITVISAEGRHERARGAPIVQAFNLGREQLPSQTEIIVKLDGDLYLPAHYFEWVAATFARNCRAGIVGGLVLVPTGSRWQPDGRATHHVSGAAKAYRTVCLDDIGGLRVSMGWDGIDEYAAKARGWDVHVLSELSVLHYGRRGAKQPWWRSRWEEGQGNHYMGYSPSFLAVRAVYQMAMERPPLLGGLVLGAGFMLAQITHAPQVDDAGAVAMLRAEQRTRLRGMLTGRPNIVPTPPPGGGPAFWA